MAVDLHVHSTESDGTDTPGVVVDLGHAAGLDAIALTDHDTVEGVTEARERGDELGIEIIPGTELSVEWTQLAPMHLLVYYLEPGVGPLQDRLSWLQAARDTRNDRIVVQLADLGIDVNIADVRQEAGGGVIGRPHFAAILVRKGYVDTMAEAFDRWLAQGRPGYVTRERLAVTDAITLAHRSGAVTSLAHPHTIGVSEADYRDAFEGLAELGLDGIEAYYAEYAPELREHLASLAERLGMVATGGSDYHGDYKPGLSVGSGRGDLVVPSEVLQQLDDRRSSHE